MQKLYLKILRFGYHAIHFALGYVAVRSGLVIPITMIYVGYQLGDLLREIVGHMVIAISESERSNAAYLESVADIFNAKKELRRDFGVYVLGLLLAALQPF